MKQSILNVGDLVKYHRKSETISNQGFELGRQYGLEIAESGALVLNIRAELKGTIVEVSLVLVTAKGELTDVADHFTKVKGVRVLPKGII